MASCVPSTPPRRAKDPASVAKEFDGWLEKVLGDCPPGPPPGFSPTQLRIVTWNVWFDDRSCCRRWQHLLFEALVHCPDVVCLQEVTDESLGIIAVSAWIGRHFDLSTRKIQQDYDLVMLVRKELRASWWTIPLCSPMRRRCLVADLSVGDAVVRVATVHLESRRENGRWRAKQLQDIFARIFVDPTGAPARLNGVLLCGDFNFCSTSPENAVLESSRFLDLWPWTPQNQATSGNAGCADDPGYTKDTTLNAMLRENEGGHALRERLDRVLMACPPLLAATEAGRYLCEPVAIELLGTKAIPGAGTLWPSDHFGLYAEVAFASSSEAVA